MIGELGGSPTFQLSTRIFTAFVNFINFVKKKRGI